MLPTIDRRATGVRLRRLMDKKNITVKGLQQYLNLGSMQSIYHWLNGITLPTIDHLYAMSDLFGISIDDMICGSRGSFCRCEMFDDDCFSDGLKICRRRSGGLGACHDPITIFVETATENIYGRPVDYRVII